MIRYGVDASSRPSQVSDAAPNPDCPGCRALQLQIVQLTERIAQLEARLNRNSSNSSRPPSSDPPRAPKRDTTREPSGRKPGGQEGHEGKSRPLKPLEGVAESFDEIPSCCEHCHALLPAGQREGDPAPQRHQVTDLVPVLVHTVEYRLHARRCPGCQHVTRAPLPEGVSTSVVGPRLQAFCSLLTGRFRLSRRSAQELVACGLGEAISLGTLCSLEAATTAALAEPYQEVATAVRSAPSVNADETPWKSGKRRLTLWLAATPILALFRIDARRTREAFELLLPYDGNRTVTSDRFSVYTYLVDDEWQICWSHLLRDFKALVDRRDEAKPIGEAALVEAHNLFHLWHRFRSGEMDRRQFRAHLRPIQARFKAVLRQADASGHYDAGGLGRNLLRHWTSLWTFTRLEGVEPTNNHAERMLRPAVLWRKGSFGHQSEGGQQFVERMLTVVSSLRLQGRSVLDYLEAACRAARDGSVAPPVVLAAPT